MKTQTFPAWMHEAAQRIAALDLIDKAYGSATPDEIGAESLVAVAFDAFEACVAAMQRGEIEQAKKNGEEAMVYMLRGASRITEGQRAMFAAEIIGRN